jgi:hypothetical protein
VRIAILFAVIANAAHAEPVELAVLHTFPGIDLVETINEGIYDHGGPPAKLDHATINFDVGDARAHTITIRKLDMVTASCGKADKRSKTDTKPLVIKGHELRTWDDAKPIAKRAASISTPAGGPRRYSVNVRFAEITTTSGCAFTIDLVVDRVRKKIELPLRIIREQ